MTKGLKPILFLFVWIILFLFNQSNFHKTGQIFNNSIEEVNLFGESWLIGSIIKNRKNNGNTTIFTTRFFPKVYQNLNVAPDEFLQYQTDLYITSSSPKIYGSWRVYKSAIRLPVRFWIAIDVLAYKINGEYSNLFPLFKSIANLLASLGFCFLIFWMAAEFGIIPGITAFLYVVFSPFANQSYLTDPVFFNMIPIIIGIAYMTKVRNTGNFNWKHLSILTIFLIALRQTQSYELTTIVTAQYLAIMLYFLVQMNYSFIRIVKALLWLGFMCVVGIILTLVIHFVLLWDYYESYDQAAEWFGQKFIQRTYSEFSEITEVSNFKETSGANTSLFQVLKYNFTFTSVFYSLKGITLVYINLITIIISGMAVKFAKLKTPELHKLIGLNLLTIITFLGLLMYFVVFKSQAADHEFPTNFFERSLYVFILLVTLAYAVVQVFPLAWIKNKIGIKSKAFKGSNDSPDDMLTKAEIPS